CVSTTNVVASKDSKGNSVTDQTYPQAQAEVMDTFEAIAGSIVDGAGMGRDSVYMDQLISFHAYGDKFVEFNDGKMFDSEGNENNERTLFGEGLVVGGVDKFAWLGDSLNIAVYYGNVANVTFISDFDLLLAPDATPFTVNSLITLLFVKTKGEWKIVHEHHSEYKPVP
ncbi:MAG: nuclear transport factor 2 family protein, partial [Desulfobulbia bacterium]